ncbi:M14 family metallopeptidase [Leadbetterella sp. DM7]|uniref:M14 family metallopeptidase n=1 Tax=Leadbetterella sp. DM7 TaxID=3235085 RepID=UPI00349E622E
MRIKLLLLGMFAVITQTLAQSGYSSHSQLSARLKALPAKSKLASVASIGKSSGGKDIWAVTLAGGDHSKSKAVLIVAGADGKHPAGTEMAVQLAEKLVALPGDSLARLLQNKTLYIIPGLNPDALEQVTARLKYERSGNATTRDDDRDGKTDEDAFEDLNGDGLITSLRVEDPTGTYVISKDDQRVLVKADVAKGENGKYLLLTEGTDNDKDGQFNEDGPGGVNIDKNFTFNYPMFEREAGEYQASEPETRAFLDFLYKNTNIHTVFHFGLSNNLSEATKFDRMNASKRVISGLLEKDAAATDMVSKMYGKAGNTDAPAMAQTPGNLTQTAYYHAGRFSYSTPGWWIPKGKDQKPGGPARKPENTEAEYLKWADARGVNSFVSWTKIEHPDFPGKNVEVGGLMPYALNNPPVQFLDSAVIRHQAFLTDYLNAMPRTELVNSRVESLGNGVNRVTVTVVNRGLLPTYPEIGDRVRYVYKVSCKIRLSSGQTLLSGKQSNYRRAMDAGESEEYSWLISGKGQVTIEGGSPTSGIANLELTLK